MVAVLFRTGYKEEGTITAPFDMTVLDDLDRFHLVMDTIDLIVPESAIQSPAQQDTAATEAARPACGHLQIT